MVALLQDLFLIGFLVFLEGVLSIDNALVLAMMARHLPHEQQRKALTYGLVGAIFFRLASLLVITRLIQWVWVKYVGGAYLIFISLKYIHKKFKAEEKIETAKGEDGKTFWRTVVLIELMDIAFAVDSILAAVAITRNFWIIFIGGFLGVIMMRFAATLFIKLLDRYPSFEATAYYLVLIIGVKLILEGLKLPGMEFSSVHDVGFWIFWGLMLITILRGFRRTSLPRS